MRRILSLTSIYLLILVGSLQSIGALTQSRTFYLLGRASCASLHPDVFDSFEGVEPLSNTYSVTVTFQDDTEEVKELSRKVSPFFADRLDYLARFGPYLFATVWFPVLDHELATQLLSHGMCNQGSFATILGYDKPIATATFNVVSRRGITPKLQSIEVSCPN